MPQTQILASKLSLFGLPIKTAMERVRGAGFQGIEVLCTNRFRNYYQRCRQFAEELGLTLHFHQAWSADEDPTDWKFRILERVGYLPQSGYGLGDNVPYDLTDVPTVIQADRLNEFYDHGAIAPYYWFQTDCVQDKFGQPKLSFSEFVTLVQRHKLPVVFDTQHYLEWKLGLFRDLSQIPRDSFWILQWLEEGWELLGPHVKEIHLNDFDPGTGARNVFPGTGVLPIAAFCNLVKRSGWQGDIVPEVNPQTLFPYSRKKLISLRKEVEWYFE